MLKLVVLLGLSLAINALVLPANDTRIYYTEHNWYKDPTGFVETANSGAYLKVRFNGTSFKLNLDSKTNKANGRLAWSIDDGPEQSQTLPATSNTITVASGLKAGTHSLYLFVSSHTAGDRWYNEASRLRILSVAIDNGAALFAPTLAPKRLMAYWDSIGEGSSVNGKGTRDAHLTWAFSLALGLNAELSLVAFSSQGYSKGGSGSSPPLWSPSRLPNESSWSWLSANRKRTFATCPDYIINGHGTNDRKADQKLVHDRSLGWLKDIRKACPKSQVFLTVPFGQFCEEALAKAFNDYQAGKADPLAHLIQMGAQGSAGLQGKGASFASVDGIHPYGWKSSQLGALLVGKIAPLVNKGFNLMEM